MNAQQKDSVAERDATIRKAIEDTLKPARIGEVRVQEDEGHYGDPIYRVDIILANDDEELDTKKVMKLWEAVMDALKENDHEVRFPIFTFMTPSEAREDAA